MEEQSILEAEKWYSKQQCLPIGHEKWAVSNRLRRQCYHQGVDRPFVIGLLQIWWRVSNIERILKIGQYLAQLQQKWCAVSTCSVEINQLECGPMPNVMVALPNIGGVLCSTPQSLADTHYWMRWNNAAKMRNQLKFAMVPQTGQPISAASGPKFTILWGTCGGHIAA